MSGTTTIVIAVVVVLAVIAVGLLLVASMRTRRSQQLRNRFGPEYERTVEEAGDQKEAERLLQQRVDRRRELPVRELDPAARGHYLEQWRAVQIRFVDDPRAAVTEADALVSGVMRDRGYPAESFEQQVADVSVDHAEAVPGYRRAHEALANARGQAATDDLRQAMVHYRELFELLVGEPAGVAAADRPQDEAADARPRGQHREVT